MIENFGRNLKITAPKIFLPCSEAELLEFLDANRNSKVRAIGRLHSWSRVIESDGVVVGMDRFDEISVEEDDGESLVRVGAGCQIKQVVHFLQQRGLTLPTLGLIDEQTIAGGQPSEVVLKSSRQRLSK